ncbi:hypothetical protein U2237_11100 [Pseudomonas syringae pv. tomato]|uniref:MoxJ protein n=3 Tax=Pseudomonas syringae group TaxID=136849 RepID=A0AAW4DU51_PSESX|nr:MULTISPECIES: hypothetical protein [Pseudomonas syringae group]KUR47650.1 hypothetical protein PSTA9_01503 [Pseudomonas syringae pv. tomato]KUR48055.1 hypothetical protein PST407_02314 [Pseudomonas syringae pv. tomato]MBI6711644.1 hypothetical protein [Pseudomonas syringae]MBI6735909.1 hypothetical protein [Pseudomonas syringae]MBX6402010.1 hypothetical protein [Pseudomonas syringae pv. tomato]
MTVDIEKLEALAKEAMEEQRKNLDRILKGGFGFPATAHMTNFKMFANPAAVMELISGSKRMSSRLLHCKECSGQGEVYSGRTTYEGYNQPPEPIMDKCGECDGSGVLGDTTECISILDEVETLRAENAGLKTGYEAYERVNAELTQRIANLELCQTASLGVSGIIKSAASELGFDAAGEDSALDYLIGLARSAAALRAENEALKKRLAPMDNFNRQQVPVIGYTGCLVCGQFTDHGGLPCPKTSATAWASTSKEQSHD